MAQRKLLLADDSITIQKVVNLTFADEGIEVLTVGDGDAAMEKLTEFKPDLIMADVNMPGLNGYQICEKIKQSADFGTTPVILLVGSFEPFDEAEARRVGADDFLTKPFQSIRQLVSKVTELLNSERKTAASAGAEHAGNPIAETENNLFVAPSAKFDDAGLDDEMIQTNQPSGFIFDEQSKFETKAEPAEDWTKTQTPSAGEKTAPSDETSEIQNPAAQSASENVTTTSDAKFSRPPAAFDDDDFLEIPFDEDEEEAETEPEVSPVGETETAPAENQSIETENRAETAAAENRADETERQAEIVTADLSKQNESVSDEITEIQQPESAPANEQNQNAASFAASPELSLETIDVIVQKVVERLSDKIVREIAWEVVPQMADLIVKKLAEEKLKE
ncbi:MAG: response regulator [Pyrinomonadaceae bacterium]